MNSNSYKIIFSKRLGTLVAVGEHTASAGKAASGQACRGIVSPNSFAGGFIDGFVGALRLTFASVSLVCISLGTTQAQSTLPAVASTSLPQGAHVNQGAAAISTSGSQMAITQTSDKASINWQSFNIGTAASVNISQPNASSVLLNRVTGNDPSQILGKLSANGQLILLNPNGVVFGKDGSVTASTFTASTFGLSDTDFMNGFYKYQRNGSTAAVVNQGTVQVSAGGFVALIGATVTNEGKIIAPQGDVVVASADSVTLPEELVAPKASTTPSTVSVRMSKRVRLELDPAAINTAVNNTESGVIVTDGGQVLLQAAALSSAVASVTQSGLIDTSAPQAGAVTVLAENGKIKVDGTIKSNSTGNTNGTANRGGDIIIGRDEETGALSQTTDVSAAKLESSKGFVETSGEHLIVDGIQVKAAQWLLDPTDITITSADSGTASSGSNPSTLAPNTAGTTASTVSATTLANALGAGTSVIVKTTNLSGSGNGDITVASNIAVTGTTDATLTLQAERDIVVNSNVSIARTGDNKLNVILNSDLDGNGAGAIVMNAGSSIHSNGGNIILGGGIAGTGADYARGYADATRYTGVTLNGATLTAAGGDISIRGKGNSTFTNSSNMRGVDLSGTAISTSGAGNITIDGVGGNGNISNTNAGVGITGASTVTGSSGGTVTLTGTGTNGAYYTFGVWLSGAGSTVTSPGNINVTGTAAGSGGYGASPGVMVQNSAAIRATGSGNLTVTGTGANTTGSDNHGVQIAGSGVLSSANGDVTIIGTSGTLGNSSFGVAIGSAGQVTTTGGNVNVTATGQISGQYGYGLWIGDTNSKISVGGNGNATINAFSSATGSTDALGAQIRSLGAVTTNNGNINFTATSRGAAGNYNIGVGFSGGSLIAGGTGTVTVTGTGGSVGTYAYGVSNANITTSGGAITINGTSSSTGTGTAAIDATTSALSTSGGNITISADSYSAGSTETINAGSGTVTIQNRTAGTLIDVGSTSADVISGTLKLGVSSAELARITAATVAVGRNDGTGSGNVIVNATNLGALGNTGGNLTVLSGNNIAINGAITKSTGTDATLTLNAVNGIDITNAAASVGGTVAGAGKLNVAMTANGNAADVANSSGLYLTKVINANGGTVSLSGTNKKSTGGNVNSGVRLSGASIYASSLSVTGNQTGTSAGSDTNGIYFSGTNTLQTTTGTSTLTGNSSAIGNFGGGIFFADSSSTTFDSGSGSINLSGLNSTVGYRGIRIGGGSNASINAKGNISFEDTQTQVMLRGPLTLQANTTVSFKGKAVSMYAGTSVVKAAGATGTTLNLDAQTVVVGEGGNADLTADTINLTGSTTGAGTTGVQINNASTLTSSGATTITASGPGTSLTAGSSTTIAATGGLTVNINNAGTLSSLVTGGTANAGGLTKQGAGTLTVGNTNTHQGTTLVSAGTLLINNVNSLQNSTLDTGTSGAQQVTFGLAGTNTYNLGSLQGADALAIGANTISAGSNNSSTTYSGILSGTGGFTKVGTGNMTLSGQSTSTGDYNANGGTLTLTGASGTYRSLTGVNVNINNGATVALPSIAGGGFISSNVTWTFGAAGGGTITNSTNFVSRGTTGNKFVTTGGTTNTISGTINLDGTSGGVGPTFDVAAGTAGTAGLLYTGILNNGVATQTFTKNGAGLMQMSGTSDLKGPVSINAGTIELTGSGKLGASVTSIAIANAGIFKSSSSVAQNIAGVISGQGSIIQAGTGAITLSADNTYSGGTTINSGSTLNVGSGATTGSLGTGAVLDNGTLVFNRNNSLTVDNAISGTGALTQTGTGTTNLTAGNTYSGLTTISAGTLKIGNGSTTGTLGTGDVSIAANSNLSFYRSDALSVANLISGTGNINFLGTGTQGQSDYQLTGNNSNFSGNINLTSSRLGIAGANRLGTAAITVNSGAGLYLNGGFTVNNALSLAGNGWNETPWGYLGALRISSGTNYAGAITLTADARIGAHNSTGTVSGIISGAKNLEFNTPGDTFSSVIRLTNANTYSGSTTINSGTLQLGNGGATGSIASSSAITDNGTLIINRSDAVSLSQNITGTGGLTQAGTGTTTLTGSNAYGITNVSAGTLQVGNGGSTGTLGTGAVTLSNNANLSFVRNADTTISNAISGTGNVSSSITGSGSDLTVNGTINLTDGLINLAADGNMTLAASIGTGNATSSAVILNAGKSTSAGTSSGGDLILSGSGTVSVGTGGRATLMTGSVAGSTGLASLVGVGNSRYNSDELSTGYTQAIGSSGLYSIYRESPSLTVTLTNDSKTYNALAYTGGNGYTVSSAVNGDTASAMGGSIVYGGTAQNSVNAGTYSITGSGLTNSLTSLGYTLAYTAGTLTVGKAALTATANSGTATYNGYDQSLTGSYSVAGLLGSDTTAGFVGISSAGVTAKNAGSYTNTITVADQTNYTVTGADGTFTIGKAVLTATGNSSAVSYSGNDQTISGFSVAGLLGSDSVGGLTGISASGATGKNFGSYTNTMTVADQTNYTVTGVNGTLSVGKANLTLSGTRAYDGTTSYAGAYLTATGVNNETFSVTGLGDTTNLSSKNVQSNIPLNSVTGLALGASGNGGLSSNYNTLTTTGSSVDVTAKAASVSATATTLTYNGATQQQTAETTTGFITGDNVVITGNASGKNANTYTSNLAVSGTDAGNYNVTFNNANLVIDKASLIVTASQATKTYDNSLAANGTGTVGALVGASNGNAVNNTGIQAFLDKNVGTNKTVRASGVSIKDSSNADVTNNYNITYVDNTSSTITPAPLIIKVNNTGMFVTQDANTATDQGFSYTGFKNGETASTALSGGALTIADRVYTGATNFPVAGTYTGVYGVNSNVSALNGNYTVTIQNGDLTVTPADKLLITVLSQSDVYGSRTSSNVGKTAVGTVTAEYCLSSANCNGANAVSLTTTQINDTQWKATDNTGSYVVFDTATVTPTYSTGGFLNAGNYGLTTTEIVPLSLPNGNFTGRATNGGVLTITPRAVSTSASAVTKVYDGSTQQFGANVTFDNAGLNDSVTLTANNSIYGSKDVGNNIAVALNALGLSGADAGNYYLPSNSANATGSITPKSLTLVGSLAANKVFDGNTRASVTTVGTLQGLIGSETLGLAGVEGFFDTPSVGANKTVSVTATLQDGTNGGLVSNYTLTPGTTTASITDINSGANGKQIIVPPMPFIPTSNSQSENSNGSSSGGGNGGGGTAGGNPYTVMPNSRKELTDRCTANSLEACACEAQEAGGIEGVAICYQPQKAASNQQTKARRI